MKTKIILPLFAALLLSFIIPSVAKAESYDLSKGLSETQNPKFFVAYVYVENNDTSFTNNPNRDITLSFLGEQNQYTLTAKNSEFSSDFAFSKYGVVRMTGYLPSEAVTLLPTASDSGVTGTDYMMRLGDTSLTVTEPFTLQEEFSELYIVLGPSDWVASSGGEKLDNLYYLFHSETQDLNDTIAYNLEIKDALFSYWQEKMNADPSIESWTDGEGNVYTRADMEEEGYPVSGGVDDGKEEEESTEEEEAEPFTPNPDQEQSSKYNIPPLFILIALLILVGGIVAITFIKKEKNKSDLFID